MRSTRFAKGWRTRASRRSASYSITGKPREGGRSGNLTQDGRGGGAKCLHSHSLAGRESHDAVQGSCGLVWCEPQRVEACRGKSVQTRDVQGELQGVSCSHCPPRHGHREAIEAGAGSLKDASKGCVRDGIPHCRVLEEHLSRGCRGERLVGLGRRLKGRRNWQLWRHRTERRARKRTWRGCTAAVSLTAEGVALASHPFLSHYFFRRSIGVCLKMSPSSSGRNILE
jgi:hypothetical protein